MNLPPCVIHEDDHLLVVNKPAGWNTHSPNPYAGEGIYEWLKHREPRWTDLAIIHRLDKDTSGVMVFGKTALANKSLTEQFTARAVRKQYVLLTASMPAKVRQLVKTGLRRAGDGYVAVTSGPTTNEAETAFEVIQEPSRYVCKEFGSGVCALLAKPSTGRTHQIRVHAAHIGCPILGDALYGGKAATRVCLHAQNIAFAHPATGKTIAFSAEPEFGVTPARAIRDAIIDSTTDSFRLIHGAADSWPGWFVERLAGHLLSASESPLSEGQMEALTRLIQQTGASGASHKLLNRNVRTAGAMGNCPQHVLGEPADSSFSIRENTLKFEASLIEGYSFGLFLDQRENRRKLLTRWVAADFPITPPENHAPRVLNVFAYTCGFSVAAAAGGMSCTSLDLSKKYLGWGRRNFALNGIADSGHDFVYGDAFDWMSRLAKKGRQFEVILLDPPTFSKSRETGVFRAEKDYGKLLDLAFPLLAPNGILLACSNAQHWAAERFVETVQNAATSARRQILKQHYTPQPPDFPVTREQPAYLKTLWLQVK